MDVKELNEAYRALTDDERDTLHSALADATRTHTPRMAWSDFGVRMYLEGRKSLLTAPGMIHEITGSRVEEKVRLRVNHVPANLKLGETYADDVNFLGEHNAFRFAQGHSLTNDEVRTFALLTRIWRSGSYVGWDARHLVPEGVDAKRVAFIWKEWAKLAGINEAVREQTAARIDRR